MKPIPVPPALIVAALIAVDNEAARRGEMFPQTEDEQREDRRAVARVLGMLRFYTSPEQLPHVPKWPSFVAEAMVVDDDGREVTRAEVITVDVRGP